MELDPAAFIIQPSQELIQAAQNGNLTDKIGPEIDHQAAFLYFCSSRSFVQEVTAILKTHTVTDYNEWHKAPLSYYEICVGGIPLYLYDLWIIDDQWYKEQRIGILVPKQVLYTEESTSHDQAALAFYTCIFGAELGRELLLLQSDKPSISAKYHSDTTIIGHICIVKEITFSSKSDSFIYTTNEIIEILTHLDILRT